MAAVNLGSVTTTGDYLKLVNLGTEYTQEMKEDISSGAFNICKVGCYLTLNDTKYIFAHPDYWFNKGATKCTTHHMVVVPESSLTTGKMASASATAYTSSYMYSTTIPNTIVPKIKTDFGTNNILSFPENLVSSVSSSGYASASTDTTVQAVIPSQIMIFGNMLYVANITTFQYGYGAGIDTTQLQLFAQRPDLIPLRSKYWLRDIYNSSYYTAVYSSGIVTTQSYSTTSIGVRPVFAIC